jgi:hypothetical protein
MKRLIVIYKPILFSIIFLFCTNHESKKKTIKTKKKLEIFKKHQDFNSYWYSGKAEITSYKLSQVRYGEIHEGTAVNIFVTENFLPEKQVKADYINEKNIPVLKLNSTKKFTTGIYPYSLMTSTFSPIKPNKNALKISFSAQEWCGNTFIQLNNRKQYDVNFYSYFESNTDRKIELNKDLLENELWNILRISPENLPVGILKIIPSFEYLGLNHKIIKAYEANVSLKEHENLLTYKISYPSLKRTLSITITKSFPYIIENWKETIFSKEKRLTTTAKKIKTVTSAYWNKNSILDTHERKELGLER